MEAAPKAEVKAKRKAAPKAEAEPKRQRMNAKGPGLSASQTAPTQDEVANAFKKVVDELASAPIRTPAQVQDDDDDWQVPAFGRMMVDTIRDHRFLS